MSKHVEAQWTKNSERRRWACRLLSTSYFALWFSIPHLRRERNACDVTSFLEVNERSVFRGRKGRKRTSRCFTITDGWTGPWQLIGCSYRLLIGIALSRFPGQAGLCYMMMRHLNHLMLTATKKKIVIHASQWRLADRIWWMRKPEWKQICLNHVFQIVDKFILDEKEKHWRTFCVPQYTVSPWNLKIFSFLLH